MFKTHLKLVYCEVCEQNFEQIESFFASSEFLKSLQNFKFRANKCDFSKEEALIFELLCEVKSDLEGLKNELKNGLKNLDLETSQAHPEEEEFFEYSAVCERVGFEEFEIRAANFTPGAQYFAKMFLPGAQICFFCRATSAKSAQIYRIKRADEESLNHYVADLQRHLIQRKKDEQNAN